MSSDRKIVVIGAGIIGASIAFRLREAGAKVTLVDIDGPGGVASRASFGWINATFGNPQPYFQLRLKSMREWEELGSRFPELTYRKSGTLYVHFDRVDLQTFHAAHSAWGYALNWIDRDDALRLEPRLRYVPDRCLHAPDEGTVDAEAAARCFVELFLANGGQLLSGAKAQRLISRGSRVIGVTTDQGDLLADHVVVAAGSATQPLAATAGVHIPIRTPVGLLVHTKPCASLIERTILTKGLHIQQKKDGSLLAGADFGGGDLNDANETGAMELLRRIQAELEGARDVELDRFTVGFRPTPEDGLPIVGFTANAENLYVATMHSGATLAPIVGRLACKEILQEQFDELLSPFRPGRFSAAL